MDDNKTESRRATLEEILRAVEEDPSLGSPPKEGAAGEAHGEGTHEAAQGEAGDIPLGALLSGAGVLSKLPALMELMRQLNQPPEPYCSGKPTSAQCTTLLRALRPYLNQNRQKTVDTMVRLCCLRDGISALR